MASKEAQLASLRATTGFAGSSCVEEAVKLVSLGYPQLPFVATFVPKFMYARDNLGNPKNYLFYWHATLRLWGLLSSTQSNIAKAPTIWQFQLQRSRLYISSCMGKHCLPMMVQTAGFYEPRKHRERILTSVGTKLFPERKYLVFICSMLSQEGIFLPGSKRTGLCSSFQTACAAVVHWPYSPPVRRLRWISVWNLPGFAGAR